MGNTMKTLTGACASVFGGAGLLALALIPMLRFGPVDLSRNAYNFTTGDHIVLRQELLDYSRVGRRDKPFEKIDIKETLQA